MIEPEVLRMSSEEILLEVRHLKKYFPVRKGVLQRIVAHVKAVDDVDLEIKRGETLGLVGESGCGKTTVGRTLIRLYDPTEGDIFFRSHPPTKEGEGAVEINIAKVSHAEMKSLRRDIQIIFQDPFSSLDPRMTVEDIVGEPLRVFGAARGREREERILQLLSDVGLKPDHMKRYPHEFSGGQRQRIGIARALALRPQLIVADEPVSSLDVSIQAQVLNLLEDLQEEFGLTYLFITHNLSVVKHISTRVAVMYLGKIMELAGTEGLFFNPRHPYTEALMSAVPVPDPDHRAEQILLEGDVPSPIHPPSGCPFHPRCPYAKDRCSREVPEYRDLGGKHFVRCHFADSLTLRSFRPD
jgi:oligopeptide/dipeptide ABC transporter ATP-binding protein